MCAGIGPGFQLILGHPLISASPAQEYPTTAAFSIITKVLDEYIEQNGDSWQKVDADVLTGNPLLELAIVKYQDHTQADKLSKIQKDLDETKIILHQARGRTGARDACVCMCIPISYM